MRKTLLSAFGTARNRPVVSQFFPKLARGHSDGAHGRTYPVLDASGKVLEHRSNRASLAHRCPSENCGTKSNPHQGGNQRQWEKDRQVIDPGNHLGGVRA